MVFFFCVRSYKYLSLVGSKQRRTSSSAHCAQLINRHIAAVILSQNTVVFTVVNDYSCTSNFNPINTSFKFPVGHKLSNNESPNRVTHSSLGYRPSPHRSQPQLAATAPSCLKLHYSSAYSHCIGNKYTVSFQKDT